MNSNSKLKKIAAIAFLLAVFNLFVACGVMEYIEHGWTGVLAYILAIIITAIAIRVTTTIIDWL